MQCLESQNKVRKKFKDLDMKEINNLVYTIEINFPNNSEIDAFVSIKFDDSGLKTKIVRVGDVSVTEETINGRVLSGRFDDVNGFCGYKYDYLNGENLLNINDNNLATIVLPPKIYALLTPLLNE